MDQRHTRDGFDGGGLTSGGQIDNLAQLKGAWPGICNHVRHTLDGADAGSETSYRPLIGVVNQLQQTLAALEETRAMAHAGGTGRYGSGDT